MVPGHSAHGDLPGKAFEFLLSQRDCREEPPVDANGGILEF